MCLYHHHDMDNFKMDYREICLDIQALQRMNSGDFDEKFSEISQHLLDGLAANFQQLFLVPRRCSTTTMKWTFVCFLFKYLNNYWMEYHWIFLQIFMFPRGYILVTLVKSSMKYPNIYLLFLVPRRCASTTTMIWTTIRWITVKFASIFKPSRG